MASQLRRWATTSALLLTLTAALIYMGALWYAQSIRIPYNGISVSEELNFITGRLGLWNAWFFGLLMLASTLLCWHAVLRRAHGAAQDVQRQRKVKLSLLLVPLVSFLLFMLTTYSLALLLTGNLESKGPGISTPTPVRTR